MQPLFNPQTMDTMSFYNTWSQVDLAQEYLQQQLPVSPVRAGPPFFAPSDLDGDPLNKSTSSDTFGLANSGGSAGFAVYDCVSRVLEDDEHSLFDGTFSAGASFNASSFNNHSFSATIGPPMANSSATTLDMRNASEVFSFDRFV